MRTWPQNIAGRISEAAMGGTGAGDLIASAVQWTEKNPWRERPKFDRLKIFFGSNKKQRSCDGRGGARSAPFGVAMNPKRRVRAAHGRAREAKTH